MSQSRWYGAGFVHLLAAPAPGRAAQTYLSEVHGDEGEAPRFEAFSHAQVLERAGRFADLFAARGIGAGDRVALMMETHGDYLCATLGLGLLGAIWVPVGTRLIGANLDYIFTEAGVKLLLAEARLAPVVAEAGHPDLPVIWRDAATGLAPELATAAPRAAAPLPDPDDIFMISFTSGTTGRPKAVPVTHAMLRFAAEGAALAAQAGAGDVLYTWEPLHHIGGAQLVILPLIRDAHLALTRRFSASRFWDEVRACGGTRIHHLGGILQMLLKQPPAPGDRDHGVTLAWGGGCTPEVWRAFEARFGVPISECYGMTEASSISTINDEGLPGFVGRAVPWVDVAILAPDGASCPAGTRGEIVLTPKPEGLASLFAGYLNAPEATRESLRDGRYFTGDLGEMDAEGRVRFHGRLKETIRVRGENVSAWEVEHVVAQHAAVAACAAIGVKAEIGEADIKLVVERAGDSPLSGEELFDWLRTRLPPHQLPRFISFVPGFERTPSLRIMKHRLDNAPCGDWTRN